jgi:hypothetical protein
MPSKPQLIQHDFTAGIRRSRSRDDLGRAAGANVLWDARDYIIGRLGVPLGKRGGWTYQGTAPDDEEFTVTKGPIRAMSNDPFNGGNFMRAIDKNLNVWRSDGPSFGAWVIEREYFNHAINRPANCLPKQNGVFIADGLFFPSDDGTNYGSTHNELYGTDWNMATAAGDEVIYLCSHLNRLVGLDTHENLWFGDPNPTLTVWDELAKYGLQQPGRGLISLGEKLLVFFDGESRLVLGSNPAGYGVTQDDIEIKRFTFDIGLLDAFSIVRWNTQAIWADHNGIYATDGSNYPLDLTWAGNAKDLWLEFIANYDTPTTTRVACGIYSDLLVCSMTDLSGDTAIDTIVCDLNRRTWSRWTNTPFTCFVRGSLNTAETWAGIATSAGGRVAAISPVLTPTWANNADADGNIVLPSFETAYYRFGPQDGRIHRSFLGYEIDFNAAPGAAASGTLDDITVTALTTGIDGNLLSFVINLDTATWGGIALDDSSLFPQIGVYGDESQTKQDIVDAINGWTWTVPGVGFTATVPAPNAADLIGNTNPVDSHKVQLSGGTADEIADAVTLDVTWTEDPKAAPTFGSYANTTYQLQPRDRNGVADKGYHWKPVPMRVQAPGVSIKVQQAGPSAKTSIHGIGIEYQPFPNYSES